MPISFPGQGLNAGRRGDICIVVSLCCVSPTYVPFNNPYTCTALEDFEEAVKDAPIRHHAWLDVHRPRHRRRHVGVFNMQKVTETNRATFLHSTSFWPFDFPLGPLYQRSFLPIFVLRCACRKLSSSRMAIAEIGASAYSSGHSNRSNTKIHLLLERPPKIVSLKPS